MSIPGTLNPLHKHPEWLLLKFHPNNVVLLEDHVKQFIIALNLMNVKYEDVICRLFPYTFKGKASTWFFNLASISITSWKQLEVTFMAHFSNEETSRILFLHCSFIRINKKEKVKYFNQIFITLLNKIPNKPVKVVQI